MFIDARNLGVMLTRRLRELTDQEIINISNVYNSYKSDENYEDVIGFCKEVTLSKIKSNNYVLLPSCYIDISFENKENQEFFDIRMKELTFELSKKLNESKYLEEEMRIQLRRIGYEL